MVLGFNPLQYGEAVDGVVNARDDEVFVIRIGYRAQMLFRGLRSDIGAILRDLLNGNNLGDIAGQRRAGDHAGRISYWRVSEAAAETVQLPAITPRWLAFLQQALPQCGAALLG